MKKSIAFFTILIILTFGYYIKKKNYTPKYKLESVKKEIETLSSNNQVRNGDIIFQTSLSGQSKAIQFATNSKYSHCGLIFHKENDNENWYVIEAVQPVKWTPLDKWIARGKDEHYVIKRLQTDSILSEPVLLDIRKNAERYLGKNYDLAFEWSDEKIYCSELIWKAYKQATQIEICDLEKLKDFDLTNEVVKVKIKERYGYNIPLDENVISPRAIFESNKLKTIFEN